jgi:hypothetical protein
VRLTPGRSRLVYRDAGWARLDLREGSTTGAIAVLPTSAHAANVFAVYAHGRRMPSARSPHRARADPDHAVDAAAISTRWLPFC